jgi:uncharacterized membrane protein
MTLKNIADLGFGLFIIGVFALMLFDEVWDYYPNLIFYSMMSLLAIVIILNLILWRKRRLNS